MNTKIRKVAKTKEGLPKKYVPASLTKADREKQIKSIKEQKARPKLKSFKSQRSSHVINFEKKYGTKITNKKFINDNLLSYEGQKQVIKKGMAAYYTGSRPNQTPASWSLARLASALLKKGAFKVDKNIFIKYGKGALKKAAEKL